MRDIQQQLEDSERRKALEGQTMSGTIETPEIQVEKDMAIKRGSEVSVPAAGKVSEAAPQAVAKIPEENTGIVEGYNPKTFMSKYMQMYMDQSSKNREAEKKAFEDSQRREMITRLGEGLGQMAMGFTGATKPQGYESTFDSMAKTSFAPYEAAKDRSKSAMDELKTMADIHKMAKDEDKMKQEDRRISAQITREAQAFTNAPHIKPLLTSMAALPSIKGLIADVDAGNGVSFQMLGAAMKKLAEGGGQSTDQDVVRYTKDPSWLAQAETFFTKGGAGVPPKDVLDKIKAVVLGLERSAKKDIETKLKPFYDSVAYNYSMTPEEVKKRTWLGATVDMPQEQVKTGDNFDQMSDEQIDALYKQAGGR